MILRVVVSALIGLISAFDVCGAQDPAPLRMLDLRVAGVGVDDDSGLVRRQLGAPLSTDSTGWHYADLRVFFKDGKVAILSIVGRSRATVRGLKVGDTARRVATLYRPCYADSLLVQVCFNPQDFDERAVIATLSRGRVSRISIGRIIEP